MKKVQRLLTLVCAAGLALTSIARADVPQADPLCVSGRYPHLAMFNHFGEVGCGAVAAWAGRLWVITYAPHQPHGSDDKLYEIDDQLQRTTCPQSVGGTPADRMIHRESNQLIIGPYFIDADRNVRAVSPKQMPGRLTAAARHLTDPANKVYIYDMEGTLFEVDVHTLAVTRLFDRCAPGAHGKGAYTAQGRLVIANNGQVIVNKAKPAADNSKFVGDPEAAGALAEWDGKTWDLLQRREFTDVTGPGGIEGSPSSDSPLWAIGWDKRSVILELLDHGQWHTFRLPIGDYSYVANHGYYTEWPRIRDVGDSSLLMNMHGQWFHFPKQFAANQTAGIRPIGDYLKITGDFCTWNNRLVFACDDASMMENPLLGQSQSNLWFASKNDLARCGQPAGAGGPWVDDAIKANQPSDPYLLAGYDQRVIHLTQDSDAPVNMTLEVDAKGDGNWATAQSIAVPPHGYAWKVLPPAMTGEWVRVRADHDCPHATVYFIYGPGGGATADAAKFSSLPDAGEANAAIGGTLRPLPKTGTLLYTPTAGTPQEVSADLKLQPYAGQLPPEPKSRGRADPYVLRVDDASLIFTQNNIHFRLPVATPSLATPQAIAGERGLREVVTERFLLNAGGSFFMVPDPSAGGAMRMKPVSTHGKHFSDFCSWRGITVLAGGHAGAAPLWFGDIDDLWRMGKPRGHGGPWLHTDVQADQPSDPYLMGGYDHKVLTLSNEGTEAIQVELEVDICADNSWHTMQTLPIPAGQNIKYEFPAGYSAQWLRFRSNKTGRASAQLDYD